MELHQLQMARSEARGLFRSYRAHVHYSTPIDRECMRAFQLLAQGRLVIKAIASIIAAGVNADGFPKLAICRADAPSCRLELETNGAATMTDPRVVSWRGRRANCVPSRFVEFPRGAFPIAASGHRRWSAEALLPLIPLHLRPKRGLANYHVLWEAEWTRVPPGDPFLLRRIGLADLWLVVAQWDLTEVERAVLASRMGGI